MGELSDIVEWARSSCGIIYRRPKSRFQTPKL